MPKHCTWIDQSTDISRQLFQRAKLRVQPTRVRLTCSDISGGTPPDNMDRVHQISANLGSSAHIPTGQLLWFSLGLFVNWTWAVAGRNETYSGEGRWVETLHTTQTCTEWFTMFGLHQVQPTTKLTTPVLLIAASPSTGDITY